MVDTNWLLYVIICYNMLSAMIMVAMSIMTMLVYACALAIDNGSSHISSELVITVIANPEGWSITMKHL